MRGSFVELPGSSNTSTSCGQADDDADSDSYHVKEPAALAGVAGAAAQSVAVHGCDGAGLCWQGAIIWRGRPRAQLSLSLSLQTQTKHVQSNQRLPSACVASIPTEPLIQRAAPSHHFHRAPAHRNARTNPSTTRADLCRPSDATARRSINTRQHNVDRPNRQYGGRGMYMSHLLNCTICPFVYCIHHPSHSVAQ